MRYIATLCVFLCGMLIMSACSTSGQRSEQERLLIVCTGWNSIFSRIDVRDQFGLASDLEVEAVNMALPILNPICTSDLATASGFDILTLEAALLAVITAKGEE